MAISGASAQEASAGLIQLSQGLASGTLRGDELRSVLEQLPKVADVIAQSLGITRGELRTFGEQGLITAEQVTTAFLEAGDELDRQFKQTAPTLGQAVVGLQNSFVEFGGAIKDIVAPPVIAFLRAVSNQLSEVSRALGEIQALSTQGQLSGPASATDLERTFFERGITAEGGTARRLNVPENLARDIARAEFEELSGEFTQRRHARAGGGLLPSEQLKEFRADMVRINETLKQTSQILDALSQARGIPRDVLQQAASIVEGDVVIDEEKLAEVMRDQAKAADELTESTVRANAELREVGGLGAGAALAFRALKEEVSATNIGFDLTFGSVRALTGEFANFVTGIKTAGDALRDFGRRALRVLADIAAQLVVINLIKGAAGAVGQLNLAGVFSRGGPEGGVSGPPIPGTPEADALNSRLQAERNAGQAPAGAFFGPPIPESATGSTLSGPTSGFLAMLHGTEEVRPVSRVTKEPLSAPSGGGNFTNITNFVTINAIDVKSFDDMLKEGTARNSRFFGDVIAAESGRSPA